MAGSWQRSRQWVYLVLLLQSLLIAGACAERPAAAHHTVSESDKMRALLDPIMEQSVAAGDIPGGVLLVGHDGQVIYRKAFGSRALEPVRESMTIDTIFDLASLTKCIATTTSIMRLVTEGRVRLNDPVAAYLPEFAQNGKRDITIRELLTHYSGLAPTWICKRPGLAVMRPSPWPWPKHPRIRPDRDSSIAISISKSSDLLWSRSRASP